jgi:hypothetical protein
VHFTDHSEIPGRLYPFRETLVAQRRFSLNSRYSYLALVQKGLLFDCLTTVSVMLEQPDNTSTPVGQHHQGGVDFVFDTFLHSGHTFPRAIIQLSSRFLSTE